MAEGYKVVITDTEFGGGQPPILYTKIKLENRSYADRRTVCGAGGR